jgi:hypothetical protein
MYFGGYLNYDDIYFMVLAAAVRFDKIKFFTNLSSKIVFHCHSKYQLFYCGFLLSFQISIVLLWLVFHCQKYIHLKI